MHDRGKVREDDRPRQLRVLVLCGSLFPAGGTEIYVRSAIRALAERGHRITAVSGDEATPPGMSEYCEWRSHPSLFSSSLLPGASWRCWRSTRRLQRLWEREGIDVAMLNLDAPIALQILQRGLPTVYFVHSPGTHCPSGTRFLPHSRRACDAKAGMGCFLVDGAERCLVDSKGDRLKPWAALRRVVDMPIQAHFLTKSPVVVANSHHTAAHVERLTDGLARLQVLLPPLVETTAANRAPVPNRLFIAGRLVTFKGIADAIRVAARLQQTTLVVAGDGPQRSELEQMCERLGVSHRVRFLGWVPSQVVDQEMKDASVVLLPSHWPEPFGLAGAQAAVNGRPVVAYDTGGVRSWLLPEMGALVPPHDVDALTRAVEGLCANPDRVLQCGRAGRAVAEELLLPRWAERAEVLMEQAVERWLSTGKQSRGMPGSEVSPRNDL